MVGIKFSLLICSLIVLLILNSFENVNSMHNASKSELIGRAIAKLIDTLNFKHDMKFVMTSIGNDHHLKNIIDRISYHSNFTIELKHVQELNDISLNDVIDHDASNIVIYAYDFTANDGLKLPERFFKTRKVTHRKRLTLFYNYGDINSEVFEKPDVKEITEQYCPHDYYFLVPSKLHKSINLFNNELFFKRTCNPAFHSINTFHHATFSWESDKFFIEYENFNNCSIGREIEMDSDENTEGRSIALEKSISLKLSKDNILLISETFSEKYNISFESRSHSSMLETWKTIMDPKDLKNIEKALTSVCFNFNFKFKLLHIIST